METIEELMKLVEKYADMQVLEAHGENFGNPKPANNARNALHEALSDALTVAFDAGFARCVDMAKAND